MQALLPAGEERKKTFYLLRLEALMDLKCPTSVEDS